MIIKSMSRRNNSGGQLLQYIARYLLREREKDLTPLQSKDIVLHNLRTRTIKAITAEFAALEKRRVHPKQSPVKIFHTVLSWGINDSQNISDDAIKDMARQYILLRGPNSLYFGAIHRDGKHAHVHICHSALLFSGLVNRVSHTRFSEIKEELTAYQMKHYPELVYSLPRHGSKRKGLFNELSQVQGRKPLIKEMLSHVIKSHLLNKPSYVSWERHLSKNGYEVYYRGIGRIATGIQYKGKKYRFKTLGIDVSKLKEQELKIQSRLKRLQKNTTKQLSQELQRG